MIRLLGQVNWEVVQAIAGTVTVGIAFLSILVTKDQFRKKQTQDTRNSYYGILVRDTGMRGAMNLQAVLMTNIKICKKLANNADSLTVNDVTNRTRYLLDETREAIVDVRNEMLLGANAWGDGDLVDSLEFAFEQMEDDVSMGFASLAFNGDWDASSVKTGLARVLDVLKTHDPGFQS